MGLVVVIEFFECRIEGLFVVMVIVRGSEGKWRGKGGYERYYREVWLWGYVCWG